MDGEGVAHRMRADGLANARKPPGLLTGQSDGASTDRLARDIPFEQPALRSHCTPVRAQCLQQLDREHHVSILLSLPLLDADHHALAVDIGGLQVDRLGDLARQALSEIPGSASAEVSPEELQASLVAPTGCAYRGTRAETT